MSVLQLRNLRSQLFLISLMYPYPPLPPHGKIGGNTKNIPTPIVIHNLECLTRSLSAVQGGMALDLKLFTPLAGGGLSATTWPQADYVDGSYALIQRIAKCLHTIPGTDLFDPSFGTDLVGALTGLSPSDGDTATERVAGIARDCVAQLKPVFAASPDPSQRLLSISVASVKFNDVGLSWDVALEVTTEATTITVNL